MNPWIRTLARVAIRVAPLTGIAAMVPGVAHGQGLTTAAIEGRITDGNSRPLHQADVTVTNQATGGSTRGRSREDGAYLLSGLEVGGPYAVSVRHIGQAMQTRAGIYLRLGERFRLDFQLDPQAVSLAAVETRASQIRIFSRTRTGTEAFIDDSTIHRMPIVNRDMYDLLRLVPHVATWNTLSASGASPRVNSIRIDGVSDQTIFGAVPAGSVLGGRSISLEAVKEYQVLLSPSDVRYGGFSGATIIGVTRRGTNELHGGAFVYGTNERLGADVPFIRDARYSKTLLGFLLGGPVVRDRLHFFVATEFQQRRIPALGPYLGQGVGSETPMPVTPDDVLRFQSILSSYSLDGGTGDVIVNPNPAANVFVRFDASLSRWNSRVVLLGNYSSADTGLFARPTPPPNSNCPTTACFPLSSLQQRWAFEKRSLGAQVYTSFAGADNELIVGHIVIPSSIGASVRQPLILVTTLGPGGEPVMLQSGSHENATADSTVNWNSEIIDNLTITRGRHRITIGTTNSFFRVRRFDLRAAYGVWEFASLDSFAAGVASSYRVRRNVGAALASIAGSQHALYVGDEWDVSRRLLLTLGMRADVVFIRGRPPHVPAVDSIFHHRTDDSPSGRVQWSPRLGFNYSLGDGGRLAQIRGGIGVLSGRPAGAWLFASFANYGIGNPTLHCGTGMTVAGPPPPFRADHRDPPTACANGVGVATTTSNEVDLVDASLRFPQVLRVSLATDRQLAPGLIGTLEGLYTRGVWNSLFTPLNLGGPTGMDRRGRVMYGSVATTGIATPNRVTTQFGDVIRMGNHSKDYSYDLTARIARTFARRGDLQVAFTHGRARDVQSHRVIRPVLIDNWRFGRTVVERQDALTTGISDFDQPFRLRANGRLLSPWRRWGTDLSFYYTGASGLPYSYVAGGAVPRGDLNADGATGNDPIYLPRSAQDTAEIQFAGTATEVVAQQAAFDAFIEGDACLRRQRGQIMRRNSCRTPWINLLNAAVRQSMPSPSGQLAVELQFFNVLNLISSRWGRVELPTLATPAATTQVPLLSQVGQTVGLPEHTQPIYRFDTAMRRYSSQNFESFYQIQFAVRYDF
jgi:hypothetical protein